MKLKREPAFGAGTDEDPTPGKHALPMANRAQSVGLTTTSLEFVLKQALANKHNHGNLPNGKLRAEAEATEPLATGPNRYPPGTKRTSATHHQ